jgi:flagellar biogenesis protein FliO
MTWPLLLQAVASLVAVLALVLLAGYAARLRAPTHTADPHALQLAATLALDARRRLHLVHAPGGAALVLTGGLNDTQLPWPPPAAAGTPAANTP